ncbi:MAG TPA: peptidoglycan DD-metalloendopeptidase family protein [Devosiaceae bacterium]|jgi:septal ring factor EnvC (AmiA/AmiB activator)|nr:peptidoglycan DD-metalloendopeptidase family protein [Devosiaceae bacterium]
MPGTTRHFRTYVLAALVVGCAGVPLLAQTGEELAPPAEPSEAVPLRPGHDLDAPATDGEAGAVTPTAPDAATSTAPDAVAAAEQQALAEIEASITLSEERRQQLKDEIAEMQGDRARQNAALIAAAQRVRLAEIEVAAMEERLDALIIEELEMRGRLRGAGDSIASVLAALQRISRNPPPALIVDPSDALGSARTAMLISAVVPQLRAKAEALTADLERLNGIKAAALREEELLKANFEILEEEQLRIATLIVARKQGEDRIGEALEAEEAEAEALASKAASLKQLIDDLTQRATAVAVAADATALANTGGDVPKLDPETIRLALSNSERQEPAVPFEQARGFLTLPSSGVRVIDYGAGDGFGGISRGISMVTRAEAEVVAPADGWVLYRGNYLNYGQIVILDAGQDYTILLAGLDEVSVDIGDFVLMGEPIGTMGSRTIAGSSTSSAGVSRPTLYIEMRKNDEPVDPSGWWAAPDNPTQSG